MNVLSLFDGISCGMVALERAGIKVDRYVAYEINESSIKISQKNYPKIEHMGDVKNARFEDYLNFDLVIGGSPCQDISNMNKQGLGLDGEKSSLFFEYLMAINTIKPKFFLLENVVGKKLATEEITKLMGVEPIKIDSKLVSAQNRRRLYWTNIPGIVQPEDRKIFLRDVLQDKYEIPGWTLSQGRLNWLLSKSGNRCLKMRFATIDGDKAQCLTARAEKSWNSNYVSNNGIIRNLTPVEYERLQTLPDNYTDSVCDRDRYSAIGDGWTVDVIAHIFSFLPEEYKSC